MVDLCIGRTQNTSVHIGGKKMININEISHGIDFPI